MLHNIFYRAWLIARHLKSRRFLDSGLFFGSHQNFDPRHLFWLTRKCYGPTSPKPKLWPTLPTSKFLLTRATRSTHATHESTRLCYPRYQYYPELAFLDWLSPFCLTLRGIFNLDGDEMGAVRLLHKGGWCLKNK